MASHRFDWPCFLGNMEDEVRTGDSGSAARAKGGQGRAVPASALPCCRRARSTPRGAWPLAKASGQRRKVGDRQITPAMPDGRRPGHGIPPAPPATGCCWQRRGLHQAAPLGCRGVAPEDGVLLPLHHVLRAWTCLLGMCLSCSGGHPSPPNRQHPADCLPAPLPRRRLRSHCPCLLRNGNLWSPAAS